MNSDTDTIARNLYNVRQTIEDTARTSARSFDAIRLIAVSKGHSKSEIATALDAGQLEFGESTTQESLPKISQLANPSIVWHFVGHLQSNKAKSIATNFSWLHSLDSIDLARKLSRLAREKSTKLNILIEVNTTRDPKKYGVAPEALPGFLEQLLNENLPTLSLRGLMTIGPLSATEKDRRECFAGLRHLRDDCRQRFNLPGFSDLSMGMSGDYVEAIREGATLLRIGTAIFGAREYRK